MPQITEQDLQQTSDAVSVLEQGVDGGFLESGELTESEIDFCNNVDWIDNVVRFQCRDCGNWHTAKPGETKCLRTQRPVDPNKRRDGYRIEKGLEIGIDLDWDYNLSIEESSTTVDGNTLPYKSIVFVPDIDEITFSDRAGSTVLLPMTKLSTLIDESSRREMVSKINDLRERLVDWDRLDDQGGDFQEIVFRLVSRDDNYFNESWGGTGPDQGKDGFCSIDLGGRETRVLVQAKFNNDGSAVSSDQVEKSSRKAKRNDCRGVIIGTVKSSGDLETEHETGALQTRDVMYLRIWSGPVLREKLSKHPDLISRFFLK
jgi:hypothetical protein